MLKEHARILVTRRLPPAVEERLARDFVPWLNRDDAVLDSGRLLELARSADAILTCTTERWSAETIEALPRGIAMIATFSVGTDHIDLEACRRKSIIVSNTPDVLTESTADITMLCLLGASRRAHENQSMLREGRWLRWSPIAGLGVSLQGRNLGIVGMGRIGRAVARRARAFGLTIHYHNRTRLSQEMEQGATYHGALDDMLPHCHFLSFNCPGSAENSKLLNDRRINLLPENAVVVNTARGNIVDDDALIDALMSGRLLAAGLDVFAGEPNLDARYRDLPNCFLLPHIGSATIETRTAMGMRCLDNLEAFFGGREPPHRVV